MLRTGAQFRWPNCVVPFTIDPALPNQARVTDAIAHWEANTRLPVRRDGRREAGLRHVPRRAAGARRRSGVRAASSSSISAPAARPGNTIHEIGHVVGLWHEQSREDRDAFVTINWANIQPGVEHNFNQHITDGDDIGAYDYGSIMHYPRDAFSIDGSDTITPTDPGAVIGQRTALSAGDIAAANSVCPVIKAPKEHIKDLRLDTRKELVKDIRLDTRKEVVLDTQKELLKEGPLDPPFTKRFDPVVTPGPVVQPGPTPIGPVGNLPFAVATPHQAPELAGRSQDELQATAAEIDAQLQVIADQLAQSAAQQGALQAQYDELQALLQQALAAHDQASGP